MSESRNAQLWRDALPQLQRASSIHGSVFFMLRCIMNVLRHVREKL